MPTDIELCPHPIAINLSAPKYAAQLQNRRTREIP